MRNYELMFIVKTAEESDGAKKIAKAYEKIITDADLTRAISKELKKYNKDFAYVYQNRDKII